MNKWIWIIYAYAISVLLVWAVYNADFFQALAESINYGVVGVGLMLQGGG